MKYFKLVNGHKIAVLIVVSPSLSCCLANVSKT